MSLGFRPNGFRHGLGRNAFVPLDDRALKPWRDPRADTRVIGVAEGGESRAYSVRRLIGHEVANSRIGERPISAVY